MNVGFVFPVSMSEELLNIKNVSKAYAGVQALDSVSMLIRRGEIHCLVGENGSGKSTLIKTLAGVVRIDSGEILINGRPYRHLRAIDAIREGIQVIYQDLSLYPRLTVAENISLNQMVEKGCKLVRWKEVKTIARQELYKIGVNIDIDAPVEDLSMANKQIVAIVRALTQNARLMVMDEPTTALTKNEIDSLFAIILECRSRGISTLFVSHKLSEVLEISEKVTVLRDGRKVGEFTREELDTDKLIFHMTGKT
ncbi:MAG: putative transporter ATP-binding protein, partial [Deltaproteobacteria bacterium]|nr:putative transporter ATP-binding protein [Deltaproteobacteria bacterium]